IEAGIVCILYPQSAFCAQSDIKNHTKAKIISIEGILGTQMQEKHSSDFLTILHSIPIFFNGTLTTFFQHFYRLSEISQVVHESGPQEWSVVHKCSPWTRSTKGQSGTGTTVDIYRRQLLSTMMDLIFHFIKLMIRTLFESGQLNSADTNTVKEASKKLIIGEDLVCKRVEHLEYLKLKKTKRAEGREEQERDAVTEGINLFFSSSRRKYSTKNDQQPNFAYSKTSFEFESISIFSVIYARHVNKLYSQRFATGTKRPLAVLANEMRKGHLASPLKKTKEERIKNTGEKVSGKQEVAEWKSKYKNLESEQGK
ncbi:Hypothetical predicted protein, partial [Paramuricea clavata]